MILGTGHQSYPAFTMKSSDLLPLMVLLALGILAPWTVEGGKNGEMELLLSNTAWRIRGVGAPDGLGCVPFYRLFLSLLWTSGRHLCLAGF